MTRKKLQAFVKENKGKLFLDLFNVVRLYGWAEDDMDFYYRIMTMKGLVDASCVGRLIPLKGVLPKKDYDMLDKIFNYNVPIACQAPKGKKCRKKNDFDRCLSMIDCKYQLKEPRK